MNIKVKNMSARLIVKLPDLSKGLYFKYDLNLCAFTPTPLQLYSKHLPKGRFNNYIRMKRKLYFLTPPLASKITSFLIQGLITSRRAGRS